MHKPIFPIVIAFALTACGGSDAGAARDSDVASDRTNLVISVSAEDGSGTEPGCMLRIAAENRQARKVNVMLDLDASAPGAELSSPKITAAFAAPPNGSGQYPDYSVSGARCGDISLQVTGLTCVFGDPCVAQYRSSGIARLAPPQN